MRPIRVLIAEDDALTTLLLNTLFNRSGFDVITLTDGQAALSYVEQSPGVDIVLLDLLLPLVSGYTILERIHEHPRWQHTRVMILSAKDQSSDQRQAMALGAHAYWVKPFDPDALSASVAQLAATLRCE
jgi:DNA-binding response OmpR family regulator